MTTGDGASALVEWLLGGLLGALMLFVGWSRSERNARIDVIAAKQIRSDAKLDNLEVTVARDYPTKPEVRLAIDDAMKPVHESLARIETVLQKISERP